VLGRRAKAGVLVAALLVLAVEGVLLVRYYDRYYGSDAASGTASGAPSSSALAFEVTMPEGATPEGTMLEATASEQTTETGEAMAEFLAGRVSIGLGILTRGIPGSDSGGAPRLGHPRHQASSH